MRPSTRHAEKPSDSRRRSRSRGAARDGRADDPTEAVISSRRDGGIAFWRPFDLGLHPYNPKGNSLSPLYQVSIQSACEGEFIERPSTKCLFNRFCEYVTLPQWFLTSR